jgi:carbamoyltransferase
MDWAGKAAMKAILGISAYYHDSAAALLVDGRIVAAAQEERFSRVKHDSTFPKQAVEYCMAEAGLDAAQLDYVAFYEKPLAKFDRLLETFLACAPRGLGHFCRALPVWLRDKLHLRRRLLKGLPGFDGPIVFPEHHESHAASAFFPSPFTEAAILTLDGAGEWSTTTKGVGAGHRIHLSHHMRFPHSLGLLYSAFTYYCGFKVNSGEYKLMGLAPYGKPRFAELIYSNLIDVKPDGTFRLDMRYFDYLRGNAMTNNRFEHLFGGPPRLGETPILQRHMDVAASVQAVTEEIVLRLARDLHKETEQNRLVLAGGVALNCVANGRLAREGPFEEIWVQPAAGDAGGALGAALFVWHQLLEHPRRPCETDAMQGSLLGPSFAADAVESHLEKRGMASRRIENRWELSETVARLLADGKIVGWFQGRMEFGPRALGARSILADPRPPDMQSRLNLQIKFRESFRPFAPAVTAERARDWFELPGFVESPYMLLTAAVQPEHRSALSENEKATMESDPDLCQRVNVVRSSIPAVTHVDWSARVQTVDVERNPAFHRLLEAFESLTGCPVLVNTSFNVRGEPIVCTPEDAIRCFQATGIDVLVMENFIIEKTPRDVERRSTKALAHVSQFPLD